MILSHESVAILSLAISLVGYIPYIMSILRGRTKPHVLTWFIWALMIGVIYVAQLQNDAGPGAWVMLLSCCACSLITFLSLFKGEFSVARLDIAACVCALVGIGLWGVTGDALLAVLLMVIVDLLAMVPTFRKTWRRPHEELAWLYGVNVVRFTLSIFALKTVTVVTAFGPIFMAIAEGGLAVMIIYRRFSIMERRRRLVALRVRR